jgi:hypothetical protein
VKEKGSGSTTIGGIMWRRGGAGWLGDREKKRGVHITVWATQFLKEVSRIQALLCMYFFVLLVESLLERELRQAMVRTGVESLRLYPEGRACRYPTVRRLIEVFEDVQRHRLKVGSEPAVLFTTKLSPLQKKILRLLGLPLSAYDA